jgi:hypothetical protein
MIHYHGQLGGKRDTAARFLNGRHALVSYANPSELSLAVEYCQSFVVDNGAWTFANRGAVTDWRGYYEWVAELRRFPNFDWAIIPDIIGGSEADNDALLSEYPHDSGVPVWHANESTDRLVRLVSHYARVAIGKHPEYGPGSLEWWKVIGRAMDACTDADGCPVAKLHGLRMLDPAVFTRLPLSSADSVSVGLNADRNGRWGIYKPPSDHVRLAVLADRIESFNAAPRWERHNQHDLWDTSLFTSQQS